MLCNDYRNPALVAKMAATLDVISDGRLQLGLGAGWRESEYKAYGWEYHGGFERLMRLDEGIRLMKEMWSSDEPQFSGDHYKINGATCEPRPVQEPHLPILVGGVGEQVTLKLVAKHADAWNTDVL
jgi:alkanesulfonate monooxygenase SsuD/methylene tetrahydromethanopterin reductase-like flavin-dependent oxidoreductase (luciferase family)